MTAALVDWRLAICGLGELAAQESAGHSHVLSILDPDWPEPPEFLAWRAHARVTLRFHDTVDGSAAGPEAAAVADVLQFGDRLRAEGAGSVLIHCHAGVSRSTAAAAILLTRDRPGSEATAFQIVRQLRPQCWPNSRMIALADAVLGRDGRLIDALRHEHAATAQSHPDIAALVSRHGRAAEVADVLAWARDRHRSAV